MKWSEFRDKAVRQDKENNFAKNKELHTLIIPEDWKELYIEYDPADVAIAYQGSDLVFIPEKNLERIKKEYGFGADRFVFATCNGDPVFVEKGKIYTVAHDDCEGDPELIAENIESFISGLFDDSSSID